MSLALLFIYGCAVSGDKLVPAGIKRGTTTDSKWPTYLHDAGRSAYSPEGVSFPATVFWSKKIMPFFSGGEGFVVSPVILNGVIYAGSAGERFYALDLKTGGVLWSFKTDSPVEAPASVDESRVYFGTSEGTFYCLDRLTGFELWRFKARSEMHSAPTLRNGYVYLTPADNRVYALKKETGEKAWTYAHNSAKFVFSRFNNSAAAEGGSIFALFPDGYMVSLDAVNGKELWKTAILTETLPSAEVRRIPLASRAEAGDNRLYAIDASGMVVAFDAKTGKKLLEYGVAGAIDFALAGETLFIASSDKVFAVDSSTGSTLWKAAASYGKPLSLLASGEHVFIISNYESGIFGTNYWKSSAGYAEAFLAKDGLRAWGGKIGPVLGTPPALADDIMALVTPEGRLMVLGSRLRE